jgi:hypothetical protein
MINKVSSHIGSNSKFGAASSVLFAFTTYTFKPIVASGSAVGPTLGEMQTAYAGTPWISNYFALGTYQGYQRWTVPKTGNYTITAGGASGGNGSIYGASIATVAYGANIAGTFALTKSDVLEMVIGSAGGYSGGAHGNENGGGGGTFVKNVTTSTLLLVAGGGGGAPSTTYGTNCTRNISIGRGQSTTASGLPSACATAMALTITAPTVGYGGNVQGDIRGGAAGGGYLGAGTNGGLHCSTAVGGGGFNNGLVGGAGNTCYNVLSRGGFGGGGGGMLGGPGAAGGYTGGNAVGAWSIAGPSTYTATLGSGGTSNGNVGTTLFSGDMDDSSVTVTLPWSILWFGSSVSSINISSNGWLSPSATGAIPSENTGNSPDETHVGFFKGDKRMLSLKGYQSGGVYSVYYIGYNYGGSSSVLDEIEIAFNQSTSQIDIRYARVDTATYVEVGNGTNATPLVSQFVSSTDGYYVTTDNSVSYGSYSDYGGGGGSYNTGSSQTNAAGANSGSLGGYTGAGYATITAL